MTPRIEIIGHRGARGLFPENTVDGFRQCLDLGVRSFELDVGMTADGVVVVSHDLRLNPSITRDAAGQWLNGPGPPLHHLTFDQLRSYDVGRIRPATPYRVLYRSQKARDGAPIPTLDEVLRLSSDARFIIELKTDPRYPTWTADPVALADAVLAVVDAADAAWRVILESFDWRGPRHIRRIRPELRLAWLTRAETVRDAKRWWDGITPADHADSVPAAVAAQYSTVGGGTVLGGTVLGAESGGDVWAPAFETTTRASTCEAHDLGLRVIPWTVNRRAAMRRLIGWGVDGLITDRPDIAMQVAVDHSARS